MHVIVAALYEGSDFGLWLRCRYTLYFIIISREETLTTRRLRKATYGTATASNCPGIPS